MVAMEELDRSATAAEVAAKTGQSLSEATRTLQWLVLESRGSIKVTDGGDLIYTIPANSRQALLVHSAELRTEAAVRATASKALAAAKFTFAATLYASIAFCALLLVFLAIAASSSDSDNRGGRRGPSFSFAYFPDFWLFTDPTPVRQKSRGRKAKGKDGEVAEASLSFMQAVTAWVFGEGDVNAGFDAARWAAAATYIQAHGGVVTAEEMRPFLDRPSSSSEDESDVLPLVVRLEGEAMIEDGVLLYRFPELQKRSRARRQSTGIAGRVASALGLGDADRSGTGYVGEFVSLQGTQPTAQKQELGLTSATPTQIFGVQALAFVNALLIVFAWGAAATPSGVAALLTLSPAAPALVIKFLLPFFSAYALLYEFGPFVRWIANIFRNRGIARDNAARRDAAKVLANPSTELQLKLQRARELGSSRSIAEAPVLFDSDQSDTAVAVEADDWDRRFRDSGRS